MSEQSASASPRSKNKSRRIYPLLMTHIFFQFQVSYLPAASSSKISMLDSAAVPFLCKGLPKPFGHENRAVLSSGTTYSYSQLRFPFSYIVGQKKPAELGSSPVSAVIG